MQLCCFVQFPSAEIRYTISKTSAVEERARIKLHIEKVSDFAEPRIAKFGFLRERCSLENGLGRKGRRLETDWSLEVGLSEATNEESRMDEVRVVAERGPVEAGVPELRFVENNRFKRRSFE